MTSYLVLPEMSGDKEDLDSLGIEVKADDHEDAAKTYIKDNWGEMECPDESLCFVRRMNGTKVYRVNVTVEMRPVFSARIEY